MNIVIGAKFNHRFRSAFLVACNPFVDTLGWMGGGVEGWREGWRGVGMRDRGMEGRRDGEMEGWRKKGWRDGGMKKWRGGGEEKKP